MMWAVRTDTMDKDFQAMPGFSYTPGHGNERLAENGLEVYGPGMNGSDFFAAHAPTEIPDWFRPEEIKEKPEMPIPSPEIFKEAKSWAEHPTYDLEVVFKACDLTDGKRAAARAFQEAMELYWDICREYDQINVEERYFWWRWYYAKMMLKYRGQGEK